MIVVGVVGLVLGAGVVAGVGVGSSGGREHHDPIIIRSNEEFTWMNGVTGGSGTVEDPFVIEGWDIVKSSWINFGIWICGTTAYFVVRNCTIHDFVGENQSCQGILLQVVSHGSVAEVQFSDDTLGVWVYNCSDISMEGCVCEDCNSGFWVDDSDRVLVRECEVSGMANGSYNLGIGFLCAGSSYVVFENCSSHDNQYGIDFASTSNERPAINDAVVNCTFFRNSCQGIYLLKDPFLNGVQGVVIRGCTVDACGWDNGSGIELLRMRHVVIDHCTLRGNRQGVALHGCADIAVENCTIIGRIVPPWFLGSGLVVDGFFPQSLHGNITVSHCDMYNLETGVLYSGERNCSFTKNNIFGNMVGLRVANELSLVTWVNLSGNNIMDNMKVGLLVGKGAIVDARGNWWGSRFGPSRAMLRLRGDLVLLLLVGVCRCRPWVTTQVVDAGVLS